MGDLFANTQIFKHPLIMKNFKTLFALMIGLMSMGNAYAQGSSVKYQDAGTQLEGYLVKTRPNAPGVVIIHQWMGLTPHEKKSANKLAALGFNVLAADIYGTGIRPKDTQEAAKLAGSYKKDYKLFQSRIEAAIKELVKQGADSSRIAVMGYCFGGTGAIEAARGLLPVAGAISFHGSLLKDKVRKNGPIKTKVLVLHGADDPFETEAEIKDFQQEMREAKADWEMIYYANAVHAFTQVEAGNDNSKGAAYNALADKRSWERLRLFLNEIFNMQSAQSKRPAGNDKNANSSQTVTNSTETKNVSSVKTNTSAASVSKHPSATRSTNVNTTSSTGTTPTTSPKNR